MRRSFNTCNTPEPVPPHTYENVPAVPVHLGTRSEITDISYFGAQSEVGTDLSHFMPTRSEITDFTSVTFNSQIPLSRNSPQNRWNLYPRSETSTTASRRSRISRRTTLSLSSGFIKPVGHFSRTIKDRGRFVWELFKLNYRMLISLTLTLFVAIFVFPLCLC